MNARELAKDLMATLRNQRKMVADEIQISDWDKGRADVIACPINGSDTRLEIYEIKVSRSDFLADVRAEKWKRYQEAGPVWFAVEKGLIDKREVPKGAGLIIRHASGWRRMKKPYLANEGNPWVVAAAMKRLAMRYFDEFNQRERSGWKLWEYHQVKNDKTEFGKRVTQMAHDLPAAEHKHTRLKAEIKQLEEYAARQRDSIAKGTRAVAELRAQHRDLRLQKQDNGTHSHVQRQ